MLDSTAKRLLREQPYIKDMATLFTDHLSAIDIWNVERYLNALTLQFRSSDQHKDIFIDLRCYLEELTYTSRRQNYARSFIK